MLTDETPTPWKSLLVERCLCEARGDNKSGREGENKSNRRIADAQDGEWVREGGGRGEIRREKLLKRRVFFQMGQKQPWKLHQKKNQVQSEDKRGTNESSQRASSVPFTAVFTGCLPCLVSLSRMVGQILLSREIYIFPRMSARPSCPREVIFANWRITAPNLLLVSCIKCAWPVLLVLVNLISLSLGDDVFSTSCSCSMR